ncbi:CubicO group peptidase (beta-lactamase class C family) [Clostridium acetobutylicum]|uniref:Similar to beta-lactamase n=1 Tax=Clostridium acetobutylicum (strain ATCC 824 / DSM 792 / JCM 1419 / IAM 19013 / LMG 5710 / NBRC 13948 / NRRL B-527 / VKM B-1787 / 2291 / W) TaxID=272562 RepID=Q97ML5_CLOAB|nr:MULTISPECIES: serine hydrolase domain-containing protein [Clostridium]AAK78163.1 Similar to beta-lactamase [Clostridium acetobutylicum ATCC 824]ADZ19227.1 Beta-lactamase [Clostridium acetobutylicum EA 2018]AEI31097.1 putative beta-lactamase [Clostridium acetobutylicum DSM 1731]AWV81970.1 serine hydrolase [Clostridium acetobutylicum]MBC2395961.1 beta-lactamase family protein [Clostridium acetobutylicum]
MIIDINRLDRAFDLIKEGVSKGVFPGAVAAVGTRERVIRLESFGNRCLYPEKLSMNKDTLFDLASLTKVVATNTLFMIFLEKGLISVYDNVSYYLEKFKGKNKDDVTIFNLLTHTAGFVPCKPLYKLCKGYEDSIDYICRCGLSYKPGTKCVYSDFSYILLAYILEKIGGDTLDILCDRYIFKPLYMENTTFKPKGNNIAATEIDKKTKKPLIGVCHDENGRFFGGISGHAGLFSDIYDLCKFSNMLVNEGKGIISYASFKAMTTNHTLGLEDNRGYGWCIKGDKNSFMGDIAFPETFGHNGFTGTSLWVDIKNNIYAILLTNRVHPTRDNLRIIRFRRVFSNAVLASLTR